MAGVTLGFLRYVLGLDTIGFRKGMTQAERDLVVMQKKFDKVGQQMVGLGKNLAVGLTLPLAGFAAKGIKEAQETAEAMAQVNASLAAAGNVAGQSAPKLKAAADALELNSLYEGDEILRNLTARLLTFGKIAPENFNRAQQAIVDYATKNKVDLGAATTAIGKALNDPLKGMGALSKAGIKLEGDNLKLVESFLKVGNTAGAQAVVLGLLESKFKGSAAAAQNADPFNKLSDAFKQMAESIGTLLLPAIVPMAEALASAAIAFSALSPETQKWVAIAGAAVAAAGPLVIVLGSIVSAVAKIGPLVLALTNAWKALVGVLTLARVVSVALLPTLAPFLIPLAAIAAAVGAVYLAWKNWDKIKAIVGSMVSAVKGYLASLGKTLSAVLTPINTVTNAFRTMYDKVVGNSYVPDMVDEIGAQMARLDAVLVQPVTKATTKAAESFRDLQQQTKGLLDRLFPEAAALNTFRSELALLEKSMQAGILKADAYTAALQRLQTEGLTDEPLSFLGQGSLVPSNDNVMEGIEGALNRIPEAADQANNALMNIAQGGINTLADGLTAVIMGTAKLGDVFKTVAAQIIADLIRIQIQKLLMDTLGSALGLPGTGSFGGGLASGGPVSSSKWYVVGENGPELFAPGRSGSIISNDNMRGMGGGGPLIGNLTLAPGMTPQDGRMTGLALSRAARDRMAYSARGRG